MAGRRAASTGRTSSASPSIPIPSTTCRCWSGSTDPVATNPDAGAARHRPRARLAHTGPVQNNDQEIHRQAARQIAGRQARQARFGKRQEVARRRARHRPDAGRRARRQGGHTLEEAGYEAYIVGGAVRDLLVGLRPEGLRRRDQRHARAGQGRCSAAPSSSAGAFASSTWCSAAAAGGIEVIEVSTFRAYMDNAGRRAGRPATRRPARANWPARSHVVDADGRVLRDNVWGPQDEDAARRDFTINAMYYDPETQIVVDYHGGIKDAKKKLLRMIGDPATRYREDPVRIIRAVRFAAKLLGFKIEPKTRAPLERDGRRCWPTCRSRRLFDEMIKLLQTGHALATHRAAEGAGPAPRHLSRCSTSCSTRRSATTDASSSCRLALAGHRPRASARASRSRRASCSPACCGPTCATAGSSARRAGEHAVPGAAGRDRRRVRCAHRRRLGPRQAGRRHARDLDDAAALRAAHRQHAVQRWWSSRAFAPASTSCACAATSARSTWCWPTGGRSSARPSDDEAPRPARRGARDSARPRRVRSARAAAAGRAMRPPATAAASADAPTTGRGERRAGDGERRAAPRDAAAPRKRRRRRRRAGRAGRHAELSAAMAAPAAAIARVRCLRRPRRQPRRPRAQLDARCAADRGAAGDDAGRALVALRTAPLDAPAATTSTPSRSCAPRSRRSSCCAQLQALERARPRAAVSQRAAHAGPRPAALRRRASSAAPS